jgi:hypothetical protein
MIKRQMYGRAGFDLLRKRVILHPALPGSQNSRQSPLIPHSLLFPGMPDRHPGPAFG